MVDRERLRISVQPDKNRLDDDWVAQSSLRFSVGEELADAKQALGVAKSAVEIAKAELEQTDAELALTIRSTPKVYGLDKPTESSIRETVLIQDEHSDKTEAMRKAQWAVIEAQHEVDVLSAACEAIDDKKWALMDLVKLRLSQYFSEPRAPEGAKDEMSELERQAVRGHARQR